MTTDTKPLPERFDCTNGNTPWCQGCYTMTPDEHGDYVQWEDYERIAAAKDAEIERLRAEVERLQEVVRPKREDECLTLDHWRMRAYDLEANWSRCSRACAGEQTKREQAEAHVEVLRADAERYRWLRSLDGSCDAAACVNINIGFDWIEQHGEQLDAAIDHARG